MIECRDIKTCLDSADSLLYIIFSTYNIKRITYILLSKLKEIENPNPNPIIN